MTPDGAWSFFAAFATVLGLLFGSFLNVCIARMPEDRSVAYPPSHCPACGHNIRWYDNIPVLSWLVLRARCRDCGLPISSLYPAIELLTGLLAWLLFARIVPGPDALDLALGDAHGDAALVELLQAAWESARAAAAQAQAIAGARPERVLPGPTCLRTVVDRLLHSEAPTLARHNLTVTRGPLPAVADGPGRVVERAVLALREGLPQVTPDGHLHLGFGMEEGDWTLRPRLIRPATALQRGSAGPWARR